MALTDVGVGFHRSTSLESAREWVVTLRPLSRSVIGAGVPVAGYDAPPFPLRS